MTKRTIERISLGFAAWAASVATALAQFSQRPFAVAGGEGGGGAAGRPDRLAHGRAVLAHPSHRRQGARAAWPTERRLGPHRPRPRLWRGSRRGARTRQGGPRLLHAGQRKVAQARRGDGADGGAAAGADRDRARRRGRVRLQGDRLGNESRRRLDRARELLRRRRHGPVAGLAQGRSAHCGFEPTCRSPARDRVRSGLCGRPVAKACVQPVGGGLSRRSARRRRDAARHADTRTRPIRPSSMERFPGATRPER